MKALVLHHNLNSPGGEAAVALYTIESLHKIGYDVDLVTLQKPDLQTINMTYGRSLPLRNVRYLFPFKLNYLGIYQRLLIAAPIVRCCDDVDIVVNTNGDNLPYNIPNEILSMLYIHFPISLFTSVEYQNNKYNRSPLWKIYFKPYQSITNALMKRALSKSNIVLANSIFTRRALGKAYPGLEADVLYPPVDIDRFSTAYRSRSREPKVLVISRFTPEKGIDKILSLAKILDNRISFQVIGSLTPANRSYFNSIHKSIKDYELQHKIILTPNATNEELVEAMSYCSAYFHTKEGEHFGVSILEAMAAGLTPIVPSFGGCSEIVPSRYQYSTIGEAAERISTAISDSDPDKSEYFRNLAQEFSLTRFTERLQQFILLGINNKKKVSSAHLH